VWIPKPGSAEQRPLGIPVVRDRVVQTALRNVMEPIFERDFAGRVMKLMKAISKRDSSRTAKAGKQPRRESPKVESSVHC
jgi:retron-type reverse transcriptase